MSLTVIGSELAELAVANDGATYDPIPGVQSHEEGEGTLNQRQVKAFEGSASKLGLPDVAPITVSALANPQHPAWKKVLAGARAGTELNFRLRTREQVHFSSPAATTAQTVAIAASGAVTFAGTVRPDPNKLAPGMSIEITGQSGAIYIIDTISAQGAITVEQPESAVSATPGYSVRTPRLQILYDAVPSKPGISLANEGDLAFSVTLYPRTLTPDWTAVKTHA